MKQLREYLIWLPLLFVAALCLELVFFHAIDKEYQYNKQQMEARK